MRTRVRRLRSAVGADQRPGTLNAVLEAIRVPPPPVPERNEDRIWSTGVQELL
jgi:hypothetical protein